MKKPTEPPAAKIARYDMDYQRCIICQLDTDQALVAAPTSHEKVLDIIRECARYGDGDFPDINRRLGNVIHKTLE